ncbi:MAG: RNA-binding domain-containing protein [Ktedonobacteraceae bacterium]
MVLKIERIKPAQAEKVRLLDEGQFADIKGREIAPKKLSSHISAFANADGGDLYIGITDKERLWRGFSNIEDANGHLQLFESLFPLGTDFQYEFLQCEGYQGIVLHIQINKTQSIVKASDGQPYIRRGAQSLPVNTPEKMKRLEFAKGVGSFETEPTMAAKETITDSEVAKKFIQEVVPTTQPEPWFRKQTLIREDRPTVAGLLLFADEPQAVLQKHCGIKVYRYKTRELAGFREVLADTPLTIEGCLYEQIKAAVKTTQDITERIPKMGASGLEAIHYPPETLHEIVTNAVLHRDYSIKDDIHIRIFDDRVEVLSPGRLPAHITVANILDERFARNGALVRILNKFPDPPNKDVGEGLNTAFREMINLGLKQPIINELENAVLVLIKHEPLASPEQIILDYLIENGTIKNAVARKIAHISTDFRMKSIFNRMEESGTIEKVPGTRTSSTAYQLSTKKRTDPKSKL